MRDMEELVSSEMLVTLLYHNPKHNVQSNLFLITTVIFILNFIRCQNYTFDRYNRFVSK